MREPLSPLVAGVELGGTKCVCILASGPNEIIDIERIPTTMPAETMTAIEGIFDVWQSKYDFAALGVASFGPIGLRAHASDYGYITATTKPGWRSTDVAPRLSQRYGLPTAIDTDVSAAALAEGCWGGARGLSTYAYITVGTGVGAGIVVNGRPLAGLGHPEAGHMHGRRYPGDDWKGACIFHGDCVEGLASGFAIEQRTGSHASALTPDDPVWTMVAYSIAGLCHNLVMGSVPERILIGGGVVGKQPQLFPLIREMLVTSLAGYGDSIAIASRIEDYIVPPALGDKAGPLGAIALAIDLLGIGSRREDHGSRRAVQNQRG